MSTSMETGAFKRAVAMFELISNIHKMFASNPVQMRQALDGVAPYKSRGKGGKRPHRSVGTKAYQRMALKKRRK